MNNNNMNTYIGDIDTNNANILIVIVGIWYMDIIDMDVTAVPVDHSVPAVAVIPWR